MQKKLSRKTKIIYGFGDLGFSLTTTIIGAYFLFFLTDVVGIQPAVAGIAILVGRTWDYLNDPSDRTLVRPHAFSLGPAAAFPAVRRHPLCPGVHADVVPSGL